MDENDVMTLLGQRSDCRGQGFQSVDSRRAQLGFIGDEATAPLQNHPPHEVLHRLSAQRDGVASFIYEPDVLQDMSKPTLDDFRRWLQVEITETEDLEPSRDRDKRLMHLSAALQEAMAFDVAYQMRVEAEVPPVKTERAVRLVSAPPEVQSSTNQVGVCRHCEAELTEDLSFCAACGDFQ